MGRWKMSATVLVYLLVYFYRPIANGLSAPSPWANKKVLVVGGTGRVGGSVVTELVLQKGASVVVGGTREESFDKTVLRWREKYSPEMYKKLVSGVSFVKVDKETPSTISNLFKEHDQSQHDKFDLVVHTAGPFQGKVTSTNGVLEAAVQNKIPYVDVCDDYCTASAAKAKYTAQAKQNNVPCIISTGCWPGVSSLMAKQLSTLILTHHNENTDSDTDNLTPSDLTVNFSFFTAGSGGAGATLLVATFLILAEQALQIINGRRTPTPPMRQYSTVNFGPIVGDKDVAHLNLLETASVHDILGINNVQSLFGTAPGFWNSLLGLMAQIPSSILSNEPLMEKLAIFSLPIVRLVDMYAGATNAMRCDVSYRLPESTETVTETAIYAHENLEPCVGQCVVAFCDAILSSSDIPGGVWFPEEAIITPEQVRRVLELSSQSAHTTMVQSSTGTITNSDIWGASAK